MKSSCVRHPERESLIIIRKWQVEFCEGNKCAAALMSFLEYWHNVKMDMSYKAKSLNKLQQVPHKDGLLNVDESLFQFHNSKELSDGIMGLFGEKKIKDSLDYLVERKVISIHRNPSKRYGYDKTKYFLFYPEVINSWLIGKSTISTIETPTGTHPAVTLDRTRKNTELSSENTELSRKNTEPIAKITLETTKEISINDQDFSFPKQKEKQRKNKFRYLNKKEKVKALIEVDIWFAGLNLIKQNKILKPIDQSIIDRKIQKPEAYRGACLYNIMKQDPAPGSLAEEDELKFVEDIIEFVEANSDVLQ